MEEAKLKVEIIAHTIDPEKTAATAAHMCYAGVTVEELKKKMEPEKVKKLISNIVEAGHLSVLEHASFTFAIEGVSRALTHQLVRHRIASFSQQSQRYVNEQNMKFIIPPAIKGNAELKKDYENFAEESRKLYKKLVDAGIKKEDARFILPNACETRIIVTMNTRALYNFFERRLCTRAQWEIRMLADEMLKEARKVSPLIFGRT